MKLCHLSRAADDDGSVLLWKKQPSCHGREQNWSRAVFSLKRGAERTTKANWFCTQAVLISPKKPFSSKYSFSLRMGNISWSLRSTLPGNRLFSKNEFILNNWAWNFTLDLSRAVRHIKVFLCRVCSVVVYTVIGWPAKDQGGHSHKQGLPSSLHKPPPGQNPCCHEMLSKAPKKLVSTLNLILEGQVCRINISLHELH